MKKRTSRVTLEVTYDERTDPTKWNWTALLQESGDITAEVVKDQQVHDEPIEIRLALAQRQEVVLLGFVRSGTQLVSLTLQSASGTSLSLSTLQSKAHFPRKAVAGWQEEVRKWAESGIYKIVEVR